MHIVLKTNGKHDSVDYASVHIFDTLNEAKDFINFVQTGKQKYWTNAILVENGEKNELKQPEDEI